MEVKEGFEVVLLLFPLLVLVLVPFVAHEGVEDEVDEVPTGPGGGIEDVEVAEEVVLMIDVVL